MGRPNGLTHDAMPGVNLVTNVTYGPAGNLTAMTWGLGWPYYTQFQETRSYNPRLQLTRQTAQYNYSPSVDLEYRYSATQNNGQITQLKDWISGEEVSYQYDSLSRLISAVTTGPEWGQSYSYDGFGNRTLVTVTKGTAPAGNLTYDGMTNRITNSGFSYDANGNLTAMPGMSFYYDYDNRLTGAGSDGPYVYDPESRRIARNFLWMGEVYFYGVDGRKLGTYYVDLGWSSVNTLSENLHFAGRLVKSNNTWVVTDRLGSVVKSGTETLRYFPWGEERSTTTQNRDKFATYHRDSTGLDYALNRYYSSSHGRFLTADPFRNSAVASKPQSWNRYAYVEGDPVNASDPSGLCTCRFVEGRDGMMWVCEPCGHPTGGGKLLEPEEDPTREQAGIGNNAANSDRRIRTQHCDSLLPSSPTGDFSGGLSENVLGLVMDASSEDATLAALVTVTWWAESRFSTAPVNNGVALGPMQLVLGAWDKWLREGEFDLDDVYGKADARQAGQTFAGSAAANVGAGAHVLSRLLGKYGESAAAGYYRAGEGAWAKTPAGQEAFLGRQGLYDSWTNGTKGQLKRFFEECVRW